MDIIKAMTERWSCRAYLDKAVDKKTLEAILSAARYAPSGVNHQPWRVAVLTGKTKQNMSEAIVKARHDGVKQHPDYLYYSEKFGEHFRQRRKECGIALYKAMDIKRDDMARRQKVWEDNYYFFHAPVGLIVYLEDYLETGSWMDVGMFLQNIMLAARAYGLETVPQAALAEYPDIVREHIGLSSEYKIACGISMGYPDLDAPVNQYRLDRVALEDFVIWRE